MKSEHFVIKFYHNSGNKDDMPVGTRVTIENRESGEIIVDHTIKLFHKDKFSRTIGRRNVLTTAFLNNPELFTREQRKEIWEALKAKTKIV